MGTVSRKLAACVALLLGLLVVQAALAALDPAIPVPWPDGGGRPAQTGMPVRVAAVVTVGFTYAPANPEVNQSIAFTADAAGGRKPYAFGWNFGDGSTAVGNPANHTFVQAGVYPVTVTVTDRYGRKASSAQNVTVAASLVADFAFSPGHPGVGDLVSFVGNATGGIPPYAFTWSFGDGTGGSGSNGTHAYTAAGTFQVSLTVVDSSARTATAARPIEVTVALAADFSFAPPMPATGDSVVFSAQVTGGTGPYACDWSFGDGFTGSGLNATHAYVLAGTFSVALNVTDSAGHVADASHPLSVAPALMGNFSYTPALPLAYEPVNFAATAVGGYPPYAYAWEFGDGSAGTGATVIHSFASDRSYTVTLTVTDSAGGTSMLARVVAVAVFLAEDFSFSPTFPVAGQVVSFSAVARGAEPPYTFGWDFGDGASGAGANVTHVYTIPRSYTVTLTVLDSAGHSGRVSRSLVVTSGFAADFSFAPMQPVTDEVVSFMAMVAGATPPYAFAWALGDGTNATGDQLLHAYASPGNYTVLLTVSDAAGHVTNVSSAITVTPALAVVVDFSLATPVDGELISFNATASGGTSPYGYSWSFGDGGIAVGENTAHAYASPGKYTVTLQVSDSVGHRFRAALAVPVGPALDAVFILSPDRPVLGRDVSFVARASGGAAPYTFHWEFGDGHSAEGPEVNHTYSGFGFSVTRVVSLTVCDSLRRCRTVSGPVTLDSVFSIVLVGETAFAVVVAAYWSVERRRVRPVAKMEEAIPSSVIGPAVAADPPPQGAEEMESGHG